MSESALLIWKLRNERRIQNLDDKEFSHQKIHNRWLKAINNQLELDKLMTDDNKYQTKAINSELVLNTWKGTLKDEELLPRNWLYTPEVLVGIEPLNHLPGRNR